MVAAVLMLGMSSVRLAAGVTDSGRLSGMVLAVSVPLLPRRRSSSEASSSVSGAQTSPGENACDCDDSVWLFPQRTTAAIERGLQNFSVEQYATDIAMSDSGIALSLLFVKNLHTGWSTIP